MVRNCFLLMMFFGLCASATAQHPFYVQLLEDGRNAMVLEKWEAADRYLEIAAFGLMDEPKQLAEIYVRLVVLQDRLDQPEKLLKYRSRAEHLLGRPQVRPTTLSEADWKAYQKIAGQRPSDGKTKP